MDYSVRMALFFYPRGGSAQVVRYLVPSLCRSGIDAGIVAGSLGAKGDRSHARTFFGGLPVEAVDYTEAVAAAAHGRDPIREPTPLHPSYEDRIDVPDRVFAAVSPDDATHLERFWERTFSRAGLSADLFHLHHLTPMHAAARAVFPTVPIVGHLHGTELRMLQRIENLKSIASRLGLSLERDADRIEAASRGRSVEFGDRDRRLLSGTRWHQWRYARYWSERLGHYAALSDRLVAVAPHVKDLAVDLLRVDPEQVTVIPNGVDVRLFDRRDLSAAERLANWRRWLVEDPQGWDESGEPGSVRYGEDDLARLVDPESSQTRTVILFVGRFVNMKRVPLLLRAYARARSRFDHPAPLMIWGGNPGEWEGEHPVDIVRRERIPDVFFVGWRGHEDLPAGLNSADLMVAPSTNEPFGQVYIEAMACGVPVIATRSGGPETFVNTNPDKPNGWLAPPDDESALADTLVEAVNDAGGRERRAANAHALAHAEYSWDSVARQFIDLYDDVIASRAASG